MESIHPVCVQMVGRPSNGLLFPLCLVSSESSQVKTQSHISAELSSVLINSSLCVLGVLNVTVSAEADQSQAVCDNEIVSVPERGRIDTVTRSLLVKVGLIIESTN